MGLFRVSLVGPNSKPKTGMDGTFTHFHLSKNWEIFHLFPSYRLGYFGGGLMLAYNIAVSPEKEELSAWQLNCKKCLGLVSSAS